MKMLTWRCLITNKINRFINRKMMMSSVLEKLVLQILKISFLTISIISLLLVCAHLTQNTSKISGSGSTQILLKKIYPQYSSKKVSSVLTLR